MENLINKIQCKILRMAGILFTLCTWQSAASQSGNTFNFKETATASGLLPGVAGIYGHGAAWGDVDGDGWPDLYVGTFDKDGKRNLLFRNRNGRFILDAQKSVNISGRTTGIVFADFDNDGDADLYIGSMPQQQNNVSGNSLLENDGRGGFKNISKDNGACPTAFGGRSVTVLDFDGDGLLDILAGEDPVTGYSGSQTKSSRLFRNKGKLQFEDVSAKLGLPEGVPGYGVAAADLNNDGWPDFFLASNNGGNRIFLNDKKGRFYEADGTAEIFAWPGSGGDNMICGVSLGDVNLDGWPDIVLGPHFEEPWVNPQPLRLFLNKGFKNGKLAFEEVTKAAGLLPIPMKAPHVEIQDFDNDGMMDIYTSVVKFHNGKPYPIIFRQTGIVNGIPQFISHALTVNDFPTEEDKSFRGRTGPFFQKMLKEKKIIYTAAGPTGDYDKDGRLDMFLASWWPEVPSMLLHNESGSGNWLNLQVRGSGKINRMGIGSRIKIYRPAKPGQQRVLLGCQDLSIGFGYASGQSPIAHFGLGKETLVDIELVLPHGNGTIIRKNVKSNQHIILQSNSTGQ